MKWVRLTKTVRRRSPERPRHDAYEVLHAGDDMIVTEQDHLGVVVRFAGGLHTYRLLSGEYEELICTATTKRIVS